MVNPFDNPFEKRIGGATTGRPNQVPGKLIADEVLDFEQAHTNSDTDVDRNAMHHTLGTGPTQAAAGNHNHDGRYLKPSNRVRFYPPVTGSGNGESCEVSFNQCYYVDNNGVVDMWFNLIISSVAGVTGTMVIGNLPFTASETAIAVGRENAMTGAMLQGVVNAGTNWIPLFTYNNGFVLTGGYSILLNVRYLKVL